MKSLRANDRINQQQWYAEFPSSRQFLTANLVSTEAFTTGVNRDTASRGQFTRLHTMSVSHVPQDRARTDAVRAESTMERRTFLIGIGSLAAGSAAAVGTGAFTTLAERESTIDVVNDTGGLIGLYAGNSERVTINGDGVLEIDFTSTNGGSGVAIDSRYQIGGMWGGDYNDYGGIGSQTDPARPIGSNPDAAFWAVNQDTTTQDVTLSYEAPDAGDSLIVFSLAVGKPAENATGYVPALVVGGTHGTADSASATLEPGQYLAAGILVDTRDGSTGDDLSGTLTVGTA